MDASDNPGAVSQPDTSPEALIRTLAHRLPAYMVPAAIVPLTTIPLLPSGKVDLAALPLPHWTDRAWPGIPPDQSCWAELA